MYSKPNEAIMPNIGPAIAKSNNDLIFLGGDFIGVIAPVIPNWKLGTNVGKPIET
jgi:hypothetical protein